MQVCPSCNNALSERGSHCPSCGTQARCKACHEILDSGARFCVGCGAVIGEGGVPQTESNGDNDINATSQAYNIIRFRQDNKSCDLDAKLTDRAFEAGGEVLGLVIAARVGVPIKRIQQTHVTNDDNGNRQPSLLDYVDVDTDGQEEVKDVTPEVINQPPRALPQSDDETKLKEIFRSNDGKLKLIDSRLKATSQIEFIGRLAVLFLYLHELEGRDSVPRSALNSMLEDAKVYNGNARAWIASTKDLTADQDKVGLSVPGRERAQSVLKEIRDDSIQPKWTLQAKSASRSSKGRSAEGKENKAASKQPRGNRPRGTSYKAKVTELFSDSYFSKKRTEVDVKTELERLGFPFDLWQVRVGVVALTKSKKLSRTQNDNGDWVYQNNVK